MRNRYLNLALVTALVGIFAWLLFDSYRYFAKSPTDFMYVAAVALLGGLATVLYFKLSNRHRDTAKSLSWGVILACSSACFIFSLAVILKFSVLSPSPYLQLTTTTMVPFAGWLILMLALVVMSLREFTRIVKCRE